MEPFRLQRYHGAAERSTGHRRGVRAFAIVPGGILVEFAGGDAYLYDEVRPGPEAVKRMCEFARRGRSLSTYISRVIRGRYRLKLSREELAGMLADVNASHGPAASS